MRRTSTLRSILLLVAWALVALRAGDARAEGEPEIRSYSELEFTVRKGDRVKLEVTATGEALEAKWVSGGATVCRRLVCELDTADWALGAHRLTFVVFNARGSLFLKYRIRIVPPAPGRRPARVEPDTVLAGEEVERIDGDDLTVRSVSGRGYSYEKAKVVVVGPLPRALDWDERLRTQEGATLLFGRSNREMHVLAGGSQLSLVKGDKGRRAIVLAEGAVRSRQLDLTEPRWSIVVPPWLQVDTDAQGDVLVERLARDDDEPEQVAVTVLRGNARVFVRSDDGTTDTTVVGRAVAVPRGGEVIVRRGDKTAPRLAPPSIGRVEQRVRETTPLYLPGLSIHEQEPGTALLGAHPPTRFEEAVAMAREALAARDAFLAIEALQPFPEETRGSYDASIALGEAYLLACLDELAVAELKHAASLAPKAARPHYLLGLAHLRAERFLAARKALEDAEDREHEDDQLLHYYLGVAAYDTHDDLAARSHFIESLMSGDDPALAASARRFLRESEDWMWLDVSVSAGAIYDTNLLRLSPGARAELPGELDRNEGAGYVGRARLGLWPYRSRGSHFGLVVDMEKKGLVAPSLARLGALRQTLTLATKVAFGGGEDERGEPVPHAFTIGLDGFAESHALGANRVNDAIGGRIELGSPQLAGLHVGAEARRNVDPLPERNDLFDPIMEEVAGATDRSSQQTYYGIGLAPLDGDAWRLALDARSGTTRHTAELQRAEDYADLAVTLAMGYAWSLRQRVDLHAERRTRAFREAEDNRSDARLSLGLAWSLRLRPSLIQTLEVGSESQTSTREGAGYERRTAGLGWTLDL